MMACQRPWFAQPSVLFFIGQPGEDVGECIGDAEVHLCR